ncbi:zinc finger protein 236-like [Panonychus citri]|uniref:zinc finger protein 236-like n=1 Tax=Panonychus citri TaxID=50023 RepID=UPI00230767FE|nr:zinc finger protein 236-like [Panonychus citri]
MTNSDEEVVESNEGKVKKEKEKEITAKQPLRTLPMRQARINAALTLDVQSRDSNRVLRSSKPSTSSNSSTTKSPVKKASKTLTTSTSTSTKKTVKSKGTDASTSTSIAKRPVVVTQQVIRRPSLRAARRRIKAKNIKARSSKCQLFFCDKCDKVYDHYSELVYHQRRHTGEKPFACTWPGCSAAFSASNARVRHMRIHTGEKPYVCPHSECGRRFTYWKDLKLHKLRHSGEKPHKCTWPGCSSRFFRRDDLKHHRYTHTGEKPYKCTFPGCESAFTQKSPLNLHMRKIHKILPDSKPPDKSQVNQVNKTNEACNGDAVISNNISTPFEYPVYQTVSNNIIRESVPNNQVQMPDSNHIHHNNNNNHVTNNMMYVNSNQNVQCMAVADKLSSILVTCDVSPATVHGVSHQFNQDVNGWPGYTYVPETVDLNQNMSNTTRPLGAQPLANSSCMKEPNVITKPSDQSMNHLPNLDDLLADACAASQIPMDNSINITNNSNNNNNLNSVNQGTSSSFLANETNCVVTTLIQSNNVNVSTSMPTLNANLSPTSSTTAPTNVSLTTSISTSTNETSQQTNSPSKELTSNSIEKNTTTESTQETNSLDANKKSGKAQDSVKTTEDASTSPIKSPRPIRKRANYRIKAPETVKKIVVAIIRQKPVIETKSSKKKSATKIDKLGAKRTIAIQTTKRQPAEKTKDGKFKCDYCEREFKAKHDRDCHHMTHTGEKPRVCDWPGCDYRCITKSKLTRHQRKHTGERNYPCDWPGCGKAFSTSRHQKEHKRTHTGEKPFKCDYPGCDKWFARKDHIKNHRFTHTGEKPRKCPYPGCEAAFIQLSPLKKHMELHKRDNGPVPNRTRKRKTGVNTGTNEDPDQSIVNECPNNQTTTISNASNNVTINTNPIQLDPLTLEMVTSRMVSQHNPPVQAFNMLVQQQQQGQENQNVCLTGYESNNTINHNNQPVNIDYEVLFRHPTYC